MVALIGVGCSSAPAGTGTGRGTNTATNRAQALKFAGCMRQNGVKAFPDPDASGDLTIDQVANGSSLDTNAPAFKQALSVCKDLEPPGFTGAARSPEQQQAALKFAQCIRDSGVPDFPDPVQGEPLVDTNRIPSANRTGGMGILNSAMQKCGGIYAGQLGLKGQ
ncbi:MAG: hypothetical protein M3066_15900 [Actinomycetota bacterium]|nr:hypothetical protein [Actinomycetota bacterium]